MRLLWEDRAWDDYLYWQTTDKKTLKRINEIIKDDDVIEKIDNAIEFSRFSKFDVKEHTMDIEISIVPIRNNENISALIKFEDVTDIRKVEIEKQDFFINASHELKTPLTSIIGYSCLYIFISNYCQLNIWMSSIIFISTYFINNNKQDTDY